MSFQTFSSPAFSCLAFSACPSRRGVYFGDDDTTVVKKVTERVVVCLLAGSDFKFSMYAPSTVAAACVRLAVIGVLGDSWCSRHRLDRRLRRITHTEQVNSE